jgi:hypothetical protein
LRESKGQSPADGYTPQKRDRSTNASVEGLSLNAGAGIEGLSLARRVRMDRDEAVTEPRPSSSGLGERLGHDQTDTVRDRALHRRHRDVWRRRLPIIEREDVDPMFGMRFDIRRELRDIRHLLEDDGQEEEAETKHEL